MKRNRTTKRSKAAARKRKASIIAVGNQKGGVGKTTVTVNLAAALGEMDQKVLVVDLDPSAGATHHLGVDPYGFEGSAELLTNQTLPNDLAITETMPQNVSLIASRGELASVAPEEARTLREALAPARDEYDFIFLDTPPNPKSPSTLAAYATADWFVLVSPPNTLDILGLSEAIRDIADARKKLNPNLEILGTIFNAVDTRSLAVRDTEAFLSAHKNLRPFEKSPFIPRSVYPNRAAGQGTTLLGLRGTRYKDITLNYESIAGEIVERCHNRKAFLATPAPGSPGESSQKRQKKPRRRRT